MGIPIKVNGREIEAERGETLLSALNRNGMQVPTICNMKGLTPTGACRMCVVELEHRENLVPACSFPVEESLSIRTHSPRVVKARRTNVELLLSNHPDDCLYCERNGTCELQQLAEDLNIRERRIPGEKRAHRPDRSSPAIIRDPSKCILCARCVRVCEEIMCTSTLDFAHRGNELSVSTTLDKPLNFSNCIACGQCVVACPTGALTEHVQFTELDALINDPARTVVAQFSPAAATAVGEMLGFKPGRDLSGLIRTVLKRYGVDVVMETALGADVMIREQAGLLARRLRTSREFPLITSSCPAWISYMEQYLPELIPHLSPMRSPQQVAGSLIKEWLPHSENTDPTSIASVVISSCTAAKAEAQRVELMSTGTPLVDLVITTRELARLMRISGLELEPLAGDDPEPCDTLCGTAGRLTGVAGGEAEATMRSLYHELTGKEISPAKLHRFRVHRPFREMTVKAGNREVRMAAVSGMKNVLRVIGEIRSGKRSLDLLEVMACPDGCINGGGQPLPASEELLRSRSRAVYDMDNGAPIQVAHGNPEVQRIGDYLESENSGKEPVEWLRTRFQPQEGTLK